MASVASIYVRRPEFRCIAALTREYDALAVWRDIRVTDVVRRSRKESSLARGLAWPSKRNHAKAMPHSVALCHRPVEKVCGYLAPRLTGPLSLRLKQRFVWEINLLPIPGFGLSSETIVVGCRPTLVMLLKLRRLALWLAGRLVPSVASFCTRRVEAVGDDQRTKARDRPCEERRAGEAPPITPSGGRAQSRAPFRLKSASGTRWTCRTPAIRKQRRAACRPESMQAN